MRLRPPPDLDILQPPGRRRSTPKKDFTGKEPRTLTSPACNVLRFCRTRHRARRARGRPYLPIGQPERDGARGMPNASFWLQKRPNDGAQCGTCANARYAEPRQTADKGPIWAGKCRNTGHTPRRTALTLQAGGWQQSGFPNSSCTSALRQGGAK